MKERLIADIDNNTGPNKTADTLGTCRGRVRKKGRSKSNAVKIPLHPKHSTDLGMISISDEYIKLIPCNGTKGQTDAMEQEMDNLPVLVSKTDKASMVQLSQDQLTIKSQKGFRTARATHAVKAGCWYFEVEVVHLGATGHARVGWCSKRADIQAPVGCDKHGYCYRDIDGSKLHAGVREVYGTEGYGEGDTVGLFINIPEKPKSEDEDLKEGLVEEEKEKDLVRWRGGTFEVVPKEAEEVVEEVPGSAVGFSKNGVFQGVAFRNLPRIPYFPSASLFTLPSPERLAEVKFNFGPTFKFPPAAVFDGGSIPRPVSELSTTSIPTDAV
mmetsp:Transcript_38544/g.53516  ORF Transcript_38544/g.53516 Transcript_38544/m.53516 type:complete len:327 (+) Transcript_38544:142-1122(+)|eukprot:CAMPEP_0196580916 /NCGR_PEP_ID=MMETSP1081-20130531/31494_1 /TAXON_ID=36882 /ORGANISM="Pyramimonas amylifera, Strain CCMP720" /LENGTH=326 /DNA_ID=CAMNT_0041900949 /DNA_START=123 /DNA_END=1103 /DNA_ORIENTATION=-